jgi:hypothetical protein
LQHKLGGEFQFSGVARQLFQLPPKQGQPTTLGLPGVTYVVHDHPSAAQAFEQPSTSARLYARDTVSGLITWKPATAPTAGNASPAARCPLPASD